MLLDRCVSLVEPLPHGRHRAPSRLRASLRRARIRFAAAAPDGLQLTADALRLTPDSRRLAPDARWLALDATRVAVAAHPAQRSAPRPRLPRDADLAP